MRLFDALCLLFICHLPSSCVRACLHKSSCGLEPRTLEQTQHSAWQSSL